LQFSLQAASPETFGYALVYVYVFSHGYKAEVRGQVSLRPEVNGVFVTEKQ